MTYELNIPTKSDKPRTNPNDVWVLLADGEQLEYYDYLYTGRGVVAVNRGTVFAGDLNAVSEIDAKYLPHASRELLPEWRRRG